MRQAARAIIIEEGRLLLMHRNKDGDQYFTLVGGRLQENENQEEALKREVKEETGLDITSAQLVFIEEHPEPYNEQYSFLCTVAPHQAVATQIGSDEEMLNQVGLNVHTPVWVSISSFPSIAFRTPQLRNALLEALKNGFLDQPIKL